MMRYLLLNQMKSDKDLKRRSSGASSITAKDTEDVIVKSKYFYNCPAKKSKRFRSAFTTEQVNYLENEFRKFPYIGSSNRKEVANKLNIPERAVKIWFQNRRMKEKKESSSVNKDFEIVVLNKDLIKVTNEPLNNLQPNNGIRCNSHEQAKTSINNHSVQPVPFKTTVNEQLTSSNIPSANVNMRMGVKMNSSCKSAIPAPNSINRDAVPVIYKKVKVKSNAAPVATSKQKNVSSAPFKNQNKTQNKVLPSHCSSGSFSNIDQDTPQDLSSRKLLNTPRSQPAHLYPVNSIPVPQTISGPRLVPLPMQTCYPSPVLPPGNVIWRPVNMLSTLPVPHTAAFPLGIPQNNQGVHLPNKRVKKSCSCNCHGPLAKCYNQVNERTHPQYILAIPYSNPPK